MHTISLLHSGQCVSITSQKPATSGMCAVNRDAMPGELRFFHAGAGGYVERVPAPRVCDFTRYYDLFQLTDATDPNLLVRGREVGGKSIPAQRRLALTRENYT